MHEIAGFGIRTVGKPFWRRVPVFSVMVRTSRYLAAIVPFCLLSLALAAPQQGKSQTDIPDAPSAAGRFPMRPRLARRHPKHRPARVRLPTSRRPLRTTRRPPATTNPLYAPGVAPAPPFNVKTVPAGGATAEHTSGQDELYKIVTNVNQVLVPVMVKDDSDRLVNGLLSRDFAVFEDGKKQTLNFFTTDPFALSAAVLFDTGMPDVAVQKVIQTFSALEGAFSQFDEVSLYTYSTSVSKVTDFATVGRKLNAALENLKMVTGRNNGPPVMSGPIGSQGPIVNGVPVETGAPRTITPPKESHVLNDAIVAASLELRKRDRRPGGRSFSSSAMAANTAVTPATAIP